MKKNPTAGSLFLKALSIEIRACSYQINESPLQLKRSVGEAPVETKDAVPVSATEA